jgi:hypothetical protein
MHLDLLMAFQPHRVLSFLLVVFLGSDETFLSLYNGRPPDLYSCLAVESLRQTYTPPVTHRHIKVHKLCFPFIGAVCCAPLYLSQPYTHNPIWTLRLGSQLQIHYSRLVLPPTPCSPANPNKNPTYRIIGSNLGTFRGSSCSRDDPYPETARC